MPSKSPTASIASNMNIHMLIPFRRHLTAVFAITALMLSACTTVPPKPPAPAPQPATPPAEQPAPVTATPVLEPVDWNAVPGWSDDALEEAWPALLASCKTLLIRSDTKPEWRGVCIAANTIVTPDTSTARKFFESRFVPNRLYAKGGTPEGNDRGLITGYYEPLLRGSRTPKKPYLTPLYRAPDDLLTIDLSSVYPELKGMRLRGRLADGAQGKKVVPYFSRAELEAGNRLRGKEIVWVDDPIEAFFLQIQGSGRVQIDDDNRSETIRLAYADQNGYPYKSIGRYLIDRGEMTIDQASMQGIQAWSKAHPERLSELLNANPSFVFFQEQKIADPNVGPNGAMGVPLTPTRSIAVDPKVIPLGSPVFLVTTQPNSDAPLRRLVMAQDTGGAISAQKGSVVRADYFWGFGAAAGEQAGRMKQQGQMWILLPR